MGETPIFIGGLDRSGKTYLRFMLSGHPNLIFSHRINFWTHYYRRFGRLDVSGNLDNCLQELAESKHVSALNLDFSQLRSEFAQGEPSYARLYACMHAQYARLNNKRRWGDQTEQLEHMASAIFSAFPLAKFLHLIRDPRDRYQAILDKNNITNNSKRPQWRANSLGASTARWLVSASLAKKYQQRYPQSYRIVRYEALVSRPADTLRSICAFLGETYYPEMIEMRAEKRFAKLPARGTSTPSPLTTDYIGIFREELSPFEIAFIQQRAGHYMKVFGYERESVQTTQTGSAFDWMLHSASLIGWQMVDLVER